jgi:hypothetical protein
MSVIDPNNKPKLLVDDFIRLAKDHLNTIQGLANTQTTYSTAIGAILPGFCYWNGYFVDDIVDQNLDEAAANLKKVSTNFKTEDVPARNLFIQNYDLEKELSGEGVVYDELKKSSGNIIKNYGGTAQTTYVASNSEARKAAENYLGRAMTDSEWSNLISITYAEATTNQTERAWVMATILNRTRIGYTPGGIQNKKYNYSTVTDIINQPWQFQPVTGTRFNPGPNANFLNGPNTANATSIYGAAAKILKDVPKAYTDFTSNDPRDYGPGTSTNYLYRLRAKPEAKIIGGTIFAY